MSKVLIRVITLFQIVLFCLVSVTLLNSQVSYKDSILTSAVNYYKKGKSKVTIYEAKKHLDSVRKYFPEDNRNRSKLEAGFLKLSKDPEAQKKEEIRLKKEQRSIPFQIQDYAVEFHLGSIMLMGLMLFVIRWLWLKRKELKKKIVDLQEKNTQVDGRNEVLNKLLESRDLEIENKIRKFEGLNEKYDAKKSRHQQLLESYEALNLKYKDIIDIDNELGQKTSERNSLIKKYKVELEVFNQLKHDNAVMQDNLELAEFGIYEPHYTFETSEKYKMRLGLITEERKSLVRNKLALEGSQWFRQRKISKDRKSFLINLEKIFLRAFNGECDNLISDVSWNNILRFEERMKKTYESINKLGQVHDLTISQDYYELRLQELKLKHEYNIKREEEKEKQRRIRETIREEEKAQKDFERAQKQADKEQKHYEDALRMAEAKLAAASLEERIKYGDQIKDLEKRLNEAVERGKRAISMAQQTKTGCVYVVSNIGSFGENIYKIGMTRRLDPMDRVKELSDASVPFLFDVHAMIRSDNAPALESTLHRAFEKNRVNRVNMRKEFFNIDLSRIKEIVDSQGGSIEFVKEFTTDHEAKEYRETLELRRKDSEDIIVQSIPQKFKTADDLFSEN